MEEGKPMKFDANRTWVKVSTLISFGALLVGGTLQYASVTSDLRHAEINAKEQKEQNDEEIAAIKSDYLDRVENLKKDLERSSLRISSLESNNTTVATVIGQLNTKIDFILEELKKK